MVALSWRPSCGRHTLAWRAQGKFIREMHGLSTDYGPIFATVHIHSTATYRDNMTRCLHRIQRRGKPDGTTVEPWNGAAISEFLKPFGKLDLLAFMNRHWIAQNQPNSDFWAHEFSKHATCFSSFDVECYGPQYRVREEVPDFFETVVAYHQSLPTWGWLRAKQIAPSNETRYSLTAIRDALTEGYGKTPYISCTGPAYNTTEAGNGSKDQGKTVLSEVWYYHHVFGRVQRNQPWRVNADVAGGSLSNCAIAPDSIWYYERSEGSEM